MGIEIGIVDNVITGVISCDVCKRRIERDVEGVVLAHDTGGLLPEPKIWFAHKVGCMGPSTGHLSIQSFLDGLASSVGLSES